MPSVEQVLEEIEIKEREIKGKCILIVEKLERILI